MELIDIRLILAAAFATAFAILPATAQQPSSADIANTLAPKKATTRGLRSFDPKAAQEQTVINEVKGKKTRSITVEERTKLADIAQTKPAIDLEINFDYNSANIGPKAIDDLTKLGVALRDSRLKDAIILLAGHTDAKGGDDYNKDLADRRAEAVKQFLVSKFGLPGESLVAVGYGRERLKNSANPLAPENRRVQVVNMSAQ